MRVPARRLRKRLLRGKKPVHVRKLPQTGEKSGRRTAADGDLFAAAEDENGLFLRTLFLFGRFDRTQELRPAREGKAVRPERAKRTLRLRVRAAERCAKLHQALREFAAVSGGIDLAQPRGVFLFYGGVRHRRGIVRHAREHAQDVPVHGRLRLAEADRGDGPGRVVPDARKGAYLLIFLRENAAVFRDDHLRRLLQIPHPAVIAEALPELRQPVGRAGGQRGNVRQLREKAEVIAPDGLHARLLKHDLREPDVIRFAVAPPRQIAVSRRIPAEKQLRQLLRKLFHDAHLPSFSAIVPRACAVCQTCVIFQKKQMQNGRRCIIM